MSIYFYYYECEKPIEVKSGLQTAEEINIIEDEKASEAMKKFNDYNSNVLV